MQGTSLRWSGLRAHNCSSQVWLQPPLRRATVLWLTWFHVLGRIWHCSSRGSCMLHPKSSLLQIWPSSTRWRLGGCQGFIFLGKKNKCTWTTNRHRGHTHACNQESVSLPLESVSSDSDSEPSSPVTRTMANICKAKNGNMDLEWVSWQWCRCFWFQRIADDGVAWVIQNNAGYIQHMLNACAVVSDACRSQKLSKELSHTWERVHQSHRNFRMQFFPNTLMQMTTSCMWRNILSPCGKTLINMHVKRNHACMTNRVTDAAEILASWKG